MYIPTEIIAALTVAWLATSVLLYDRAKWKAYEMALHDSTETFAKIIEKIRRERG